MSPSPLDAPDLQLPSKVRTAARTITGAGWSLALVAVVGGVVSARTGWQVFEVLWVTSALLAVCSLLIAALPVGARFELGLIPPRAVAGGSVEVQVRARAALPWPVLHPLVSVPVAGQDHDVRLPTLYRGRGLTETVPIEDLRRGVHQVGPVRVLRQDPLGLIRWAPARSGALELVVLPRIVHLETLRSGGLQDQEGLPSDEISMSDLAFHALREYAPGDDLRHVHWRSSAKADSLQVRQYQDTRRSHVAIVVEDFVGAYGSAEDFETAVSVAGSIAARSDSAGMSVSLSCGSHAVVDRGAAAALELCARLERSVTQREEHAVPVPSDATWLVHIGGHLGDDAELPVDLARVSHGLRTLVVRCGRDQQAGLARVGAVQRIDVRTLDDLPGLFHGVAR